MMSKALVPYHRKDASLPGPFVVNAHIDFYLSETFSSMRFNEASIFSQTEGRSTDLIIYQERTAPKPKNRSINQVISATSQIVNILKEMASASIKAIASVTPVFFMD